MAVRLSDESIIAVKYDNALPTIAIGTRVAVNPELTLISDGGFQVEAELGSVVECADGGLKCHVRIDAVRGKPPLAEPRTIIVEPWTAHDTLVLEAAFLRQANLITTASTIDLDARAVRDAGTAESRQVGKVRLRHAADAALKWRQLENHSGVVCLAALNQLAALRRLLHCHLAEAAGHSALTTVREVTALMEMKELWTSFPRYK